MKAIHTVVVAAWLVAASTVGALAQSAKSEWPASELGCGNWTDDGDTLRREYARSLGKSLEGFRELQRRFRIEEMDIDCGNRVGKKSAPSGASLFVALRAKANGVPNGIEVSVPLECCWKATSTWGELLDLYERATTVVSRHKWLGAWAARAKRNEVRILAFGASGVADSENEIATYVRPAWNLAGLKGEIAFQVLLRRNGEDPAAKLYFSDTDERALVTITWPSNESDHWLDTVDIQTHPTDAPRWDYITIGPDGEWKRPTYDGGETR